IRRFIETHNMHAAKPFRWTKAASVILDAVERARQSLRQETSRTGH
ncbi:MAG: IS630 family transposase, partial [Acidobacteria bacterium]|nr:IS630 family transposase [Acidobacteriota bacterium]MCY4598338.1 IS630 family transposase [Acidobacteriota bacterium]MCY4598489.1 IS630 family transposase [Acidobacteriota bacterium]MCY4598897.1 IS630 family transposase [Acidobacteriota bacterium]